MLSLFAQIVGVAGALFAFWQWLYYRATWRSDETDKARIRIAADQAVEDRKGELQAALAKYKGELDEGASERLERLKGDIRREVEESLTKNESRLRLQADLRLRMHDRSWGLLRDFTAASWKTHEALFDFALAAVSTSEETAATAHTAASAALGELRGLCATLPPEAGDVKSVLADFQAVYRIAIELSVPDEGGPKRTGVMVSKRAADDAFIKAERLALAWNKALWADAAATPETKS